MLEIKQSSRNSASTCSGLKILSREYLHLSVTSLAIWVTFRSPVLNNLLVANPACKFPNEPHSCRGANTIPPHTHTNIHDGSWLTTRIHLQKMSQYHLQLISLGRGPVAQTSCLLCLSLVVGSTRGAEKEEEGGVRSLWQAASHTADSSVKDSCLGSERWSGSPSACASQPLCGGEQSWADWSDGGLRGVDWRNTRLWMKDSGWV